MSWFLLAIIGHVSNGIAFIIDKILLRSAFSRSATYAGVVGCLSAIVILLVPFVKQWPEGNVWTIGIVSGATFILALWAFFASLARAEASRVVPIIGSLIPIMTLVGTYLFLDERLTDRNFVGFALLIVATVLLSAGGKGKLTSETVWLSITSAVLFAIASVTAKVTYDETGFLGGFITTRLSAVVTSVLILAVLDKEAGKEALSLIRPKKPAKNKKQPGKAAAIMALVGQTLGALGFLFVQWAVAKGSAAIVNAMQAVQYALLVVAALLLRKKAPQLLGEDLTSKTLAVKAAALALTAVGMFLIV